MYPDQEKSTLNRPHPGDGVGLAGAVRETEMQRECSRLTNSVEYLQKVVSRLQSKLDPVLRSDPEKEAGDTPVQTRNTQLGEFIGSKADVVSRQVDLIESMLRRLEI